MCTTWVLKLRKHIHIQYKEELSEIRTGLMNEEWSPRLAVYKGRWPSFADIPETAPADLPANAPREPAIVHCLIRNLSQSAGCSGRGLTLRLMIKFKTWRVRVYLPNVCTQARTRHFVLSHRLGCVRFTRLVRFKATNTFIIIS